MYNLITPSLTPSHLDKMLNMFRKKSPSPTPTSVMSNTNTSETTLVSPTSAPKEGKTRKPKYDEPYKAEFSGMSTMGGMPSLGGHMFMAGPPPAKALKNGGVAKSKPSPVKEGRESMETLTATSSASSSGKEEMSVQRKLKKQHKTFFNNSFGNT